MSVLLGFLDGQGRAYDLTFGTLKRRMKDAEGNWELDGDESLSSGVSVECALFLQTPRPHLILRPTSGLAHASARRLVFVAAKDLERTPEEPTRFNVAIYAPRTAVEHLFRAQEGRELVEIGREEIRGTTESRAELTLQLAARWMGSGTEDATFTLILRPRTAARNAVAPLRLS